MPGPLPASPRPVPEVRRIRAEWRGLPGSVVSGPRPRPEGSFLPAVQACPECGDTGWKPTSRADGSPAVLACGCKNAMRVPPRLEDIGVPARYANRCASIPSTRFPVRRSAQGDRPQVGRFYPDVKAGLLLSGPAGIGKTHLAVAALHHILFERRIAVRARFENVPQLLSELQGAWKDPSLTEEARLATVTRAEIVVLDQLGAGLGNPRMEERLLYVLNRCFHTGNFLICTTAFPVRAAKLEKGLAEQITVRGVSLLREACRFVQMRGEDYRDKVITPGRSP